MKPTAPRQGFLASVMLPQIRLKDNYTVFEELQGLRMGAGEAPMLRVGQGSTSNCSIQYLVEKKTSPHTIIVCIVCKVIPTSR